MGRLLYHVSPVSIKPVLKSVTNSIYTYPIDIQIHFPKHPKSVFNPIFLLLIFIFAIYASQTIFPKKDEVKRRGEGRGETTKLVGHSNILRSTPTFH